MGVCFAPYREQYKQLIPYRQDVHYMETYYNASEGFFGLQSDLHDPGHVADDWLWRVREFIPLEEIDKPNPTIVPLWGK